MVSVLAMAAVIGQIGVATQTAPAASVMPPMSPVPPPFVQMAPQTAPNQKAMPRTPPQTWVSSMDYPSDPEFKAQSGTTAFQLDITRWGTVSDCRVITSSGSTTLDEKTCTLVALRSSFYPATDAASMPTKGTYSSRVKWMMPLTEPHQPNRKPFPQPQSSDVSFKVGADGRVSDCVAKSEGPPSFASSIDLCKLPFGSGLLFTPGTDDKGNPVSKRVRIKSSVEILPSP